MLWVTNLAPQPHDVYWRNLNIPYRQLWIRRITTLAGAVAFMFVFLIPVTFIQGLTQLEQLSHAFPFLRGILKKEFINQAITGYIPSVILNLFFYAVPPLMMYFSTFEGCISRSITKKSACIKVLYFTIWNDFFVNSLSGSIIRQLNVFSTVRDIPAQLARAVPTQLRKSKEVTTEEYNEFYRKYFTEYLDPLASSHFTTEGEVGFRSILYVPPVSPMGKDDVVNQKTKNIRLYVKRVFISEGFDGELFPRYLSFIKGVVDSHDLPLNVSREILQDSRIVWIMKKRLVKKAFDMILGISLSENREDYEKCRANFGKYLKLGCIDDR